MTYYKYVKRDLDDQVNWAQLSKDLSDKLSAEVKSREEQKAKFDQEYRDLNKKISERPIGTSAAANKMSLKMADAATQQNLMLYKKLKSGELKPKDYVIMRQNINDSVDSYYNSLKQWQEISKVKMDRASKEDSSDYELTKMAELEGFGDFDNVSPIFTDEGRLVLAKQTTDPETGEVKMGEVKPIDRVLVDLNTFYDRFKFDKASDEWIKSVAKFGKYSKDNDGNIKLIIDANQRDVFEKVLNDRVKVLAETDPYNTLSLLSDWMVEIDGNAIEFTDDPEKAKQGNHIILMKPNTNDPNKRDVPVLNDDQKKKVNDWVKDQLKVKIEYSESGLIRAEKATPRQATEGELKRADTRKQQVNKSNMIAKLYSGDNTEVASAVNFFTGAENVRKVNRTPSGVDVTMVDSKGNEITKSLPFYADGNLIPASDWISGASRLLIGEDADPEIAKRTAIQTKGSDFNQTYTASSAAKTDQEPSAPLIMIGPLITAGDARKTAINIAARIQKELGITNFSEMPVRLSSDGRGNVIVRGRNGEMVATFNVTDTEDLDTKGISQSIYSYLDSVAKRSAAQGGEPKVGDDIFK